MGAPEPGFFAGLPLKWPHPQGERRPHDSAPRCWGVTSRAKCALTSQESTVPAHTSCPSCPHVTYSHTKTEFRSCCHHSRSLSHNAVPTPNFSPWC